MGNAQEGRGLLLGISGARSPVGHVFVDHRLDRGGPDFIPLGRGMQPVWHDFPGEGSRGIQEFVSDVHEGHSVAFQVGDFLIDLADLCPDGVACLFGAREDA